MLFRNPLLSCTENQKEISNLVFTDLASGQLLSATQRTRKWDQVLLHKIWGPIIFILIMLCLFSYFWAAAPFMDIIDETFCFLATQALHFLVTASWQTLSVTGSFPAWVQYLFLFLKYLFCF